MASPVIRVNHSDASEREPVETFEWTTPDGPSEALMAAISAVIDDDPTTMPPLYSVVDPDALDRLFTPSGHTAAGLAGSVEFEYHDKLVVVNASGRGYVYERDEPGDRPGAAPRSSARSED